MFEELKDKNKAIGVRQSLKAVESGNARVVYIAEDAEAHVVSKIKELCQESLIRVVYVESMKLLGKACGISVGAAVACLFKD